MAKRDLRQTELSLGIVFFSLEDLLQDKAVEV